MSDQDNNSEPNNSSEQNNGSDQIWYENNEVLYGWIIIFFPVAIYGYWQRKDFDQNTRWIYTVITAVVAVSLLGLDSVTRYAIFLLAAPGYAWYIWSNEKVNKPHKLPLVIGAVVLVLSGISELGSRNSGGYNNSSCPRMIRSSNGCTVVYKCDGTSTVSC